MGEKLQLLFERAGWSDREVSRRVGGVSPTTVGRWKTGQTEPRLSEAARLARVLGVPLSWLADDTQDEPPRPADLPGREVIVIEELVRRLGYEEAMRRLLYEPPERVEPGAGRPSKVEVRAGVDESLRRRAKNDAS